jgi:hypothetical protein
VSWKWNENTVLNAIRQGNVQKQLNVIDELPQPADVRKVLDDRLQICRKPRSPRLILVEKVNDYEIYISIPDGKSDCDFIVWRYSPNLNPPVKIPKHDEDLGSIYVDLKKKDRKIDEYLINATFKLLRDRWSVNQIINNYFNDLSITLKEEIRKFLVTLKWIGLQEDANYPPPKYLGSKMTLAVYALLEAGFDPKKDIRKILRF